MTGPTAIAGAVVIALLAGAARGGACGPSGLEDPCRLGLSETDEGLILPDRRGLPELGPTRPRLAPDPPSPRPVRAAAPVGGSELERAERGSACSLIGDRRGPVMLAVWRLCVSGPSGGMPVRGDRTRPPQGLAPLMRRDWDDAVPRGPIAPACSRLRDPALEARPLDDTRAQALSSRLLTAYVACDAPRAGADIAALLADELPRLHAAGAVTEKTLWHWDHALSQLPLEAR
ncbi:MAG: hypothetical protein ACFBRM_10410 [Pikeienuella sp.]